MRFQKKSKVKAAKKNWRTRFAPSECLCMCSFVYVLSVISALHLCSGNAANAAAAGDDDDKDDDDDDDDNARIYPVRCLLPQQLLPSSADIRRALSDVLSTRVVQSSTITSPRTAAAVAAGRISRRRSNTR